MRGIDNKKFFMTLEEFENLVNKENNELINGKKIIVDEKILSEIDSFKNYSFKIEKDEPNNNTSSSSSDYCRLIDNYENNNKRSNHLNEEYLGSDIESISYVECDIYLGKHLIILYETQMNVLIICKYIKFDRIHNYFLLKKEIVLLYEKLELHNLKKEVEEISRYNLNEYLLNKYIDFSRNVYHILNNDLNKTGIILHLNEEFKEIIHKSSNLFYLEKISEYFRYYNKKCQKENNNEDNINENKIIDNNINSKANEENKNEIILEEENNILQNINSCLNFNINNSANKNQISEHNSENKASNLEIKEIKESKKINKENNKIIHIEEEKKINDINEEIKEDEVNDNNDINNTNDNNNNEIIEENIINEEINVSNMRENELINQENRGNSLRHQNNIENSYNMDNILIHNSYNRNFQENENIRRRLRESNMINNQNINRDFGINRYNNNNLFMENFDHFENVINNNGYNRGYNNYLNNNQNFGYFGYNFPNINPYPNFNFPNLFHFNNNLDHFPGNINNGNHYNSNNNNGHNYTDLSGNNIIRSSFRDNINFGGINNYFIFL